MRIMMSAAGSAVAPGIIRHLQSLGHYVIGHDCCEYGYGASVCDEFHVSPSLAIYGNYFSYYQFLCSVSRDIYLPFIDEELRIVKPLPMDIDTLNAFCTKNAQQNSMELAGLPIVPLANTMDMAYFKPDYGRGSRGGFKAIVKDAMCVKDYIAQRFIEGDEYTVDVLTGLDGKFLYAVPRLRIQANGVSVIGKIVMDEEIIDLAQQVVRKFKFSGPINIQIIRERGTGNLYIIELNPRLSGSCMFTVMAGFDILDATIKLHEGKPFVRPTKVDEITVRRHYVEDRL